MTVQNIGYWIGQANDIGNPRPPSGYTSGQRHSESAAEYLAMYDGMVAERNTWINNYNNAIASRDYWQHTVAHNDANVWTNRYNSGYTDGNNAARSALKARSWVVGLHNNYGSDGGGWMLLDSGSPDGNYFTNSAETVYLVRTGYYTVSANLGNFSQLGGQNCCGWTGITSFLEVGGAGQFGGGKIDLSYDADDYHKGGYGWGYAGVVVYSSANLWARVHVDLDVVDGSPNFTGRLSVAYLGTEAP